MPSLDDASLADAIQGSAEAQGDVPQEVMDHIDDVFSQADKGELEGPGEATVSFSAKELARRESVKKEQEDEITQEGLDDPDRTGEKPADEGKAPEADSEGEEKTEEGQEPPASEKPVEPLDPNLRFVAQFYGLSDEQIDGLYEQAPELATQTFSKFLEAFTAMSRQSPALPTQAGPQSPPVAQQPSGKIDKIIQNLKEFSETNGEDLGGFVQALHEELIVPFRNLQAELAVQKQQAVAAEATLVTQSLAEKFPDVYGKGEKLNLIEQTNRQNLYKVADQLRAGSYQQGQEMSVKDALSRAHLIVTADKLVQSGRRQVQQQVQKRSKQITARPTQRVRPGSVGTAKGEQAATEAYERRASELGIEIS